MALHLRVQVLEVFAIGPIPICGTIRAGICEALVLTKMRERTKVHLGSFYEYAV